MVEHQGLRWIRTTLLGYIPGWTPPVKPIGVWREVRLESVPLACLNDFNLQTSLQGADGHIKLKAEIAHLAEQPCEVIFEIDGTSHSLFQGSSSAIKIDDEIILKQVRAWNPHTHGEPELYQCRLMLKSGDQIQVMQEARIGFRHIEIDRADCLFQLHVNGTSIFARGAVWTINDIVSLTGKLSDLRRALELARDAGMNMLRIGGTMVYEQDEFYDLCDELGIMVWQDFMFANMDYPVRDDAFRKSIFAEAAYQIKRLGMHPCIVVYCGNSEVEQQAAMLGIPSEMWRNDWFALDLPALVKEYHHDSIYIPSSPSEGTLPFYTSEGVTHYYGVGAYLRDIRDVRRADVRFTSECLGFSNVPENGNLETLMNGFHPVTHHPKWKSGVPRDTGAGWDFEDVRDHYLGQLFGEDPVRLRSADMERYLMLSRIASGEMMSQVFSEWRSSYSHCSGGLVWFYKDLVPGAGWGVLDSDGNPKAAYYFLKRILQPVAVVITDEGLQGLHLHVVNETPQPFSGLLEFSMIKDGRVITAKSARGVSIDPKQKIIVQVEDLLGGFYDSAYAYRFGPPKHEVACAVLKDAAGKTVSRQFHFPLPKIPATFPARVEASLSVSDEGGYQLNIEADHFLYGVHISCDGYLPDDDYFHLMPNELKKIDLRAMFPNAVIPQVHIHAVNLADTFTVENGTK